MHCRQIGCVPEQHPPTHTHIIPSHQAQVGAIKLLHHWSVDQKCHWPPSPNLLASHSYHKSLKRAPDFNAWQRHQYWCGRKVSQSRLSHRTLILIVLCTSLDIWCRSKIVIALSRVGVKGQYCCWMWTRLLSSKQDTSPRVLYMDHDKPRTYLEFGR